MFENVSIIIPFQTDNGPRDEVFRWVVKFYEKEMPEAEVCIGYTDGDEINKSKAINLAVKNSTRDILIIADADVVYDKEIILESIQQLRDTAWVVPFTEIYNIPKEKTELILCSNPEWPIDVSSEECLKENWLYDGFIGKLRVIPRKHFEAAGGFDERFIGLGGGDEAFTFAVNTLCGQYLTLKRRIFHLWHPAASIASHSNWNFNQQLYEKYKKSNGNKEEMLTIINEGKFQQSVRLENRIEETTQICFGILVHNNRELVKELIENVRFFCPNSFIVLYNGGDDPNLCNDLGVPVCPSSRKLERGFTTIYFLETMEWLEEQNVKYEYFINIDSDAVFFRKGYEDFIEEQMINTDYMAVDLRIPEDYWILGYQLRKEIHRWKQLFNVDPFLGIFNVGQVFRKSFVKALLEPERKEVIKKALNETSSFGNDEFVYVNLARELGFRIKNYPYQSGIGIVRYRPYFTLDEIIHHLNVIPESWLCHPVVRDSKDLARSLIRNLAYEQHIGEYKTEEYPWYEPASNYAPSFPIKSKFGNLEIIVQSEGVLTHYWINPRKGTWEKTNSFGTDVMGIPLFYEDKTGNFEVVCKLTSGEIGYWWRDNNASEFPWHGPYIIINENVEPIMLSQLPDDRHIIIYKSGEKILYRVRSYMEKWVKGTPWS
jgi:hypothetical protein